MDFDKHLQDEEDWRQQRARLRHWMQENDEASQKSVLQLLRECKPEARKPLRSFLQLRNCKLMEALLCGIRQDCVDLALPFGEIIARPAITEVACKVAEVVAREGQSGAERLFAEYIAAKIRHLFLKASSCATKETDVSEALMEAATEKNQRGLEDLELSFGREALVSFREANAILEHMESKSAVIPDYTSMKELGIMHANITKTASLTATECELWDEALELANKATDLQELDHLAWFCKACALIGLHEHSEAEQSLQVVEQIVTGHQDRESIWIEVRKKREQLEEQIRSDAASAAAAASKQPRTQGPPKLIQRSHNEERSAEYEARAAEAWRGWRHFEVLGETLPMRVDEIGDGQVVVPQDIVKVWAEEWGLLFMQRIRFEAPTSASSRWLNCRTDAVPPYPAVTRLVVQTCTNFQSILGSLKLALATHSTNAPKLDKADVNLERRSEELAALLAKAPNSTNISGVRQCLKGK